MADAPALGAGDRKIVGVQISPSAHVYNLYSTKFER